MTRPILGLALFALAPPLCAQAPPAAPAGISFDQWAQRARARLTALDADHDGKISKTEYEAHATLRRNGGAEGKADADAGPAPKRGGSRLFARIDANQDGFLDTTEINAMLARRFARMDANHDGVLTSDERQAMRGDAAPER
jgi:hypothetical protein